MSGLRYFYTDPLAAAWMAKHFGMKLYVDQTSDTNLDLPPIREEKWHEITRLTGIGLEASRYFIHPDSLPLLEPKVGDIAQHPMNGNCHVLSGQSCFYWFASAGMKIIQRGGIVFHWPEVEP